MSDDNRINDDDRKVGIQARIDQVRLMQEQQAQLDKLDEQKKAQLESATPLAGEVDPIADADQAHEAVDAVNTDTRALDENREDIQGQVAAQDLARAATAQQVTGSERSTEAVDAAHKQQDRGESWDKFQSTEGTDLPPSVEETAREEREDDAKQEEKERISARELQNQMAVQNRMIKS